MNHLATMLLVACSITACGRPAVNRGAPGSGSKTGTVTLHPATFVFDDAERFVAALAALPHVRDTVHLFDSAYIARGSPGLRDIFPASA